MTKLTLLLIVLLQVTFIQGCDSITSNPMAGATACSTGVAHIQVLDGSMIRTCGCSEASGTTFTTGQSLTCTVSAGTNVYFDFTGISVTHQIAITGGSATPVMAPLANLPVQTVPLTLGTAGTFPFYDVFFPTIGGSLIVQ